MQQVEELKAAAVRLESGGYTTASPTIRRSGFLLSVAALDAYYHERGIQLLHAAALSSSTQAGNVSNYLKSVSAADVSGPLGEGHIRYRLSFKTLVRPSAIDSLLSAASLDAQTIWLELALTLNDRPDRLHRLLELLYDRRNQIAHEADWDSVQLDFRQMETVHLDECMAHVRKIVQGMDRGLS